MEEMILFLFLITVSSVFFLFFIFLFVHSSVVFMPEIILADTRVPAIFVFGDSTADVGNNNYLPGDNKSKANYPHNGVDYPGGIPTGRFSNGYNGVDFLAKMMRFRESPPPVLSLTNQTQVLKGVNFASSGSGILDATGQNYSLSMSTQIMYFEDITMNKLTPQMGKYAANRFISESIFLFSTGNNDIFSFAIASGLQNRTQSEHFITLLSSQFKDQLKRLYELGARKFVVVGTSHIGCIPYIRSRHPFGSCIEELNDLSRQFNNSTKANLVDLSSTMEGMKYSFLDAYKMMSTVKENPIHYGFKEIKSACCGAGNFNAASGCIPNATYCSNREEYLFWDWVHPTQASYKLVARWSYHGSHRFATPISIKKLAKM